MTAGRWTLIVSYALRPTRYEPRSTSVVAASGPRTGATLLSHVMAHSVCFISKVNGIITYYTQRDPLQIPPTTIHFKYSANK
jgi:hypothetical protein